MTLRGSALGRVLYGEIEGAAPEPCQGAREAYSSPRGGSGVAGCPQWEGKAASACVRPRPAGRAVPVFEVGTGGSREASGIRLPLAPAVATVRPCPGVRLCGIASPWFPWASVSCRFPLLHRQPSETTCKTPRTEATVSSTRPRSDPTHPEEAPRL